MTKFLTMRLAQVLNIAYNGLIRAVRATACIAPAGLWIAHLR